MSARLEWHELPISVRQAVDAALGSPVVNAVNRPGGFSPGPTARCDLADGRGVFIKVAGTPLNAQSVDFHRNEASRLSVLPSNAPAPRLLDVVELVDHDENATWIALVIEWNNGQSPGVPLTVADIERIARLVRSLSRIDTADLSDTFPRAADRYGKWSTCWPQLNADPTKLAAIDRRLRERIDILCARSRDIPDAFDGSLLMHGDVRADNVLFGATPDEDVLVDWAHAAIGTPLFDLISPLPAFRLSGGPPPSAVEAQLGLNDDNVRETVDTLIIAMLGFLVLHSLDPPVPGLPTLRAFQRDQANVVTEWLLQRL